jgi:hypothetical protein
LKTHFQTSETPIFIDQKSQIGSSNTLFGTTRIEPTNTNISRIRRDREVNRFDNSSKIKLIPKKNVTNFNRFFPTRSPTSWSVISDHQNEQEHIQSLSPSSRRESIIDIQQPADGRHVIPAKQYVNNLLL